MLSHPVAGDSWEGFVIENLLAAAPARIQPSFYCTADGAEIDTVMELSLGETWVVEVKSAASPKLSRGFHNALRDVNPTRGFAVHRGVGRFPIAAGVESIGMRDLCLEVASWSYRPVGVDGIRTQCDGV